MNINSSILKDLFNNTLGKQAANDAYDDMESSDSLGLCELANIRNRFVLLLFIDYNATGFLFVQIFVVFDQS